MKIILYKNTSAYNVMNKKLQQVGTIEGGLIDATNLSKPTIEIYTRSPYSNVNEFNYIYIPDFHRYYYCDNDTRVMDVQNGSSIIHGACDVLMSYKDAILGAQVEVVESGRYSNGVAKHVQVESKTKVEVQVGKRLEGRHAILVTCGGGK